jgi:hypothetical protein
MYAQACFIIILLFFFIAFFAMDGLEASTGPAVSNAAE